MYQNADEEIHAELADELGDLAYAGERLPALLTHREVIRLLDAGETERDRLLLRVLYATGMRAAEAGGIKWCDVAFDEETIFVRAGKGDKDRYVCVDAGTLARLRAYRGDRPLDAEVFGLTTMTVWNVVHRAAEASGLLEKYDAMNRRVSPHTLRHAFATHCYEDGMDIVTVQLLLGHAFIDTTRIYLHVGIRHELKQYRKTHPFGKDAPRA